MFHYRCSSKSAARYLPVVELASEPIEPTIDVPAVEDLPETLTVLPDIWTDASDPEEIWPTGFPGMQEQAAPTPLTVADDARHKRDEDDDEIDEDEEDEGDYDDLEDEEDEEEEDELDEYEEDEFDEEEEEEEEEEEDEGDILLDEDEEEEEEEEDEDFDDEDED